MSDGLTHHQASLILTAGFGIATIITQDIRFLECSVGSLVGILVSPDLDLSNGGIVGGKLIRKKIGWIGERLWKWFWKDYSASFKHGTWGSHSFPFSTFIRVSYIYYRIIFVPHILIYFSFFPAWSLIFVLTWYAKIFFSPLFFYGLASSDLIHIALDKFTKESK